MAGTANIGKYGGIIEVTASTSTESNNMTGATNQPWLSVYETGDTLLASATPNTNANSRTASFSATVSTVSTASYPVVTTINCAWTVTQAGTGTTPTMGNKVRFNISHYNNAGVNPVLITVEAVTREDSYSWSWAPSTNEGNYTTSVTLDVGSSTQVEAGVTIVCPVPPYNGMYRATIECGTYVVRDAMGGGSVPASALIGPMTFPASGELYVTVGTDTENYT